MQSTTDGLFRSIVQLAEEAGWTVRRTRRRHWCFAPPDGGRMVFTGGSPSDRRAIYNLIADLRRAGLEIKR